jgi:hypothetical protein
MAGAMTSTGQALQRRWQSATSMYESALAMNHHNLASFLRSPARVVRSWITLDPAHALLAERFVARSSSMRPCYVACNAADRANASIRALDAIGLDAATDAVVRSRRHEPSSHQDMCGADFLTMSKHDGSGLDRWVVV